LYVQTILFYNKLCAHVGAEDLLV